MRFFLIFLLFASLVFAEDGGKKWYISLSGGGGNASTAAEKGTVSGGKFGFEYRPNPYIGFGLGLGVNKLEVKPKEDPIISLLPILFLASAAGPGASNDILPLLILPVLLTPQSTSLGYNTLNLDFNFHMNQDKTLDPYLGIGIILGTCSGGASCNITGAEGRLGLQFNFDTFFFFLQGQYQTLNFKQEGSVNVNNMIGSLGFGVRF